MTLEERKEDFREIKRDLVLRVEKIEQYIAEGNEQRKHITQTLEIINKRMNGDFDVIPPKDGHEQRISELEKEHKERKETKESFMKVAVGSLTMAIGGAVIWIFIAIKDAVIKSGLHSK